MFPLNVTEELGDWPEMHVRQRKWVNQPLHLHSSSSYSLDSIQYCFDLLHRCDRSGDGGRSQRGMPAPMDEGSTGEIGEAALQFRQEEEQQQHYRSILEFFFLGNIQCT